MKQVFYTVLSIALFVPSVAFAQNTALVNPLTGTSEGSDIRQVIGMVINVALQLSGSIALLMFVYGGFLWLTSGGNSTQIDKGKKVLIWAVLGIVLIASAYVIVNAIFQGLTTGNVTGEPAS